MLDQLQHIPDSEYLPFTNGNKASLCAKRSQHFETLVGACKVKLEVA